MAGLHSGGSAEAGLKALQEAMGESAPAEKPQEPAQAPEAATYDDGDEPEFDPTAFASELAAELSEESAPAAPSDAWKSDAKGKLIKQGYTEQEAHFMAYKMGREKVEKLLAPEASRVQSEEATPTSAPEGSAPTGFMELSESLRDQLDGPAAEELGKVLASIQAQALAQSAATADATAQELAFLRNRVMSEDVAAATKEIATASRELSETYPELRNQAQWDALKPLIKAAMPLAGGSHSKALRYACLEKFGDRTGQHANSPVDSSPSPAKRENPGAGTRAVTAEAAKSKIAQMIYSSRPADEVMGFANTTRKRLA